MNPNAPLRTIAPLEELIAASLARRRFALELLGSFALLAAALTAVGVYGLIAYTVSRRRNEFAIRRALGARGWQLAAPILTRLAFPAIAGLYLGGLLLLILRGVLRSYLYRLSPLDPLTLAGVGVALLVLVAGAALRPLAGAVAISAAAIPRD